MENTCTLVGNLVRDPELRYTNAGNATCSVGLAVNRRWQDRQTNEWVEKVSFFNLVAWGQMAENLAQSFSKGSRLVVTGRLNQRSWETEAGDKRSVIELEAYDIGASIKFDPVTVHRTERANRTGASGPQGDYEYGNGEEPFLMSAMVDDVPPPRRSIHRHGWNA